MALLKVNDILKVVDGLGDTFPKCSISDIATVEEWLFNCKLGSVFKEELESALCPENCVKYESLQTYPEGSIVNYKGVNRIALEDTDTLPSTKGKWDNAPKFCGDNCFNDFWCKYLMKYLAWYVIWNKSYAMGSKFEDNGSHVKVYDMNTSVPASDKDLGRKTKYYRTQVDMSWDNMVAYANGKECLCNFRKFPEACCKPKRKKRRRWH